MGPYSGEKQKPELAGGWRRGKSLQPGIMGCPCLVQFYLVLVREMQSWHKQVDEVTLQAFGVKVFGHDLADIILARASPAVQRERQWLLGVFVVLKARQRLHDHLRGQMLPEQLLFQVQLEGCAAPPGNR